MAFTRQHYTKIADILRGLPKGKQKDTAVDELATMFKKDNQRFDKKRFFTACGYSNSEIGDIFGVRYTESVKKSSMKLVSLLKEGDDGMEKVGDISDLSDAFTDDFDELVENEFDNLVEAVLKQMKQDKLSDLFEKSFRKLVSEFRKNIGKFRTDVERLFSAEINARLFRNRKRFDRGR